MNGLITVIVSLLAGAAPETPRIAVLDFQASSGAEDLAAALTGVTAGELQSLGAFEVTSADTLRMVLGVQRQRQFLGCAEESCITELASALGADYLVHGKVTRTIEAEDKATIALEISLADARNGRREGFELITGASELAIIRSIRPGVANLTRSLLSAQSGALLVTSSEHAAAIKIDGVIRATTPTAPMAIPAGPHLVEIEKEGFVTYQREIRIQPGEQTQENVTLVPSPDFVRDYQSRATKMRIGAWVGTALAVGGLGSGLLFQGMASDLYGGAEQPGTFDFHRARIAAGAEQEGEVDHRASANALSPRITTYQTLSWVGFGACAVGAVAATWLWIAGDSPGRYSHYSEVGVALVPTSGGAIGAMSFGF